MRPLWVEFPNDPATFAIEDQWMVGSDILVKPVLHPNHRSVEVYFPGTEAWYDVETWIRATANGRASIDAPLSKIPVFQRAGSIVPRKMRLRRCSDLMRNDPFTLDIVVDSQQTVRTARV